MKQLIARVDERLHRRLKDRAAAQRRSMNAVVKDLLEEGLSRDDQRERLLARLRAEDMLVTPPLSPRQPQPRDQVIRGTRGAGTAVSEALEAERNAR